MNISIEFKRNQWCVNSYLLKFLSWQKIFITNVAIPLGAEDSLLTRTVLNGKNKMLLHHFYLRGWRVVFWLIEYIWNSSNKILDSD